MSNIYYPRQVGGQLVPLKKPRDLFSFRNMPPIICLGATGGGKTVMALDIVHQFAKDARYIYYVSQTNQSIVNDTLKQLPSYCVRNPEDDCFQCISRIWGDIKRRGKAMDLTDVEAQTMLGILYPGKDMMKDIVSYVETSKNEKNLSDVEANALKIEISSRLIVDGARKNKDIFRDKFTDEQHASVNAMVSGSLKTILILDDLTALIEACQKDNSKIVYGSKSITRSAALKEVLNDMFTRGRHYEAIVVMFLHSLNAIDDSLRVLIDRFLFVDANAAGEVISKRKFNEASTNYLKRVIDETQIMNKHMYDHYMLYYEMGAAKATITKAELHSELVKVHPDLQAMYSIYDQILANAIPDSIKESTEDEDEEDLNITFDDLEDGL